jgi:phytoene dehydrogenase-like protein
MLAIRERSWRSDVVVVGGGLAGLVSAAKLAKAGRSVVLLEQSKHLGGRAMTTKEAGVQFNLGPRALYRHGHAFRLLRELQVPFSGRVPNPGVSLGYWQGREYRLPATPTDLMLTRLLSLRDKWRLTRFLQELPDVDTTPLQSLSAQDWVTDRYGTGALANLLFALLRVTSYSADMKDYSAGAALDQLKPALAGNVWYIDGGWQSLIDALRDLIVKWGVDVRSGERVTSVRNESGGLAVRFAGENRIATDAVVLAVSPQTACSLLQLPKEHRLARWTESARAVRAACLDIALTRVTRPHYGFALGIDQPHYLSVHSKAAKLAPAGVAVVHVMKYLTRPEPAVQVEQELEMLLDCVQTGWRGHVLTRRFLPSMLVAHDLPQAQAGGLRGRPRVNEAGIPGVYLAGDWAGHRGQIADASAASAEEAAQSALHFLQTHDAPNLQYA